MLAVMYTTIHSGVATVEALRHVPPLRFGCYIFYCYILLLFYYFYYYFYTVDPNDPCLS